MEMDDAQSSHCVLGVRRLRRALKYAVLGAAVLWILFGSYGHQTVSRTKRTGNGGTGARSLMNVESDQCHYDDTDADNDIEVSMQPVFH